MKITYIISDINHAVYFEDTAISLRNNGINISFILINCQNSALKTFLIAHNFEYYSLECQRVASSFSSILKVKKILKSTRPDIVHTHLLMANWIGLWAAKLAGIKHRIFTRHAGLPTQQIKKETFIDKIQNRLATQIIAISNVTKNILLHQGVKASKITIVHHGFHLNKFIEKDAETFAKIEEKYNSERHFPIVGVISRWIDWKGIQFIIPAFKDLLVTFPNAKLMLFNADEASYFAPTISNLLHEIPQNNYEIIAFEKDIAQTYHLFDIFVHTPIDKNCEAFGQIYIEALAAGVPSVFTLSGIAKEFIQNRKNAFVVDFKNSEQITAAMLEILKNPTTAKNIAKEGEQDVLKLFSFDHYITHLIQVYNS